MFIGVSMQLQAVFKYFLSHTVGRLRLKNKTKKKTQATFQKAHLTSTNLDGPKDNMAEVSFIRRLPHCNRTGGGLYSEVPLLRGEGSVAAFYRKVVNDQVK